jgi:glycosyltransferase involved in cell wall biosynthesis
MSSSLSISIICPLHNKKDFIGATIESVLNQKRGDWELIVVENGSTDGGPDLVNSYQDERIKFVVSPRCGPGVARNFGISHARGKWVLFLDADDLIEADYLLSQLGYAEKNPQADIIVGPWIQFRDGTGEEEVKYPPGYPRVNQTLLDSAIAFTPWAPNAAIVRRSILHEDFLWPEHMDRLLAEDTPFWFKLINEHRVSYSDCTGARYRFLSPGCRTNMAPGKWFEGLNAAVEENLKFLKSRGKNPSAIQKEQVALLYLGIYELAVQAKDKSTSSIAAQKSRFWMLESLRAGRITKLPMLIGGLFGVYALSVIKRKTTSNAG